MTQDELKTKLDLHKKWLAKSPDGVQLSLRDVDLSNLDLRGADLRRVDLTHTGLVTYKLGKDFVFFHSSSQYPPPGNYLQVGSEGGSLEYWTEPSRSSRYAEIGRIHATYHI